MYLGDFKYGQTIYVPFATYGASGESITMTGILTSDIEIYKNGSVTQRASDNGYTLLDSDGIDFDGITGVHGFSIDTSDNTTAGFFGPGNEYWIALATITVNTQTVTPLWTFSIENRGGGDVLNRTTIATLSTQTSWTLTAGSADNDAYNGCLFVCHDQASAIQKCVGIIGDYTGSTKTVTVLTDPAVFTMATGDYITILADRNANIAYWNGTAVASPDTAGYPKVTLKTGTGAGELSVTSGVATVNVDQINANTVAADNLAAAARSMTLFTVDNTGFTSTASVVQTNLTEATANHYANNAVRWYTGNLAGQVTLVESSALVSGLHRLTVSTMVEAPANGDLGVLL